MTIRKYYHILLTALSCVAQNHVSRITLFTLSLHYLRALSTVGYCTLCAVGSTP